jgi:hypothetical protein
MMIKNALKGIAIALVAAYGFGIFFGLSFNSGRADIANSLFGGLIVIPIIGLLYSFWFVIPIGAILGILIPKIARNYSRKITLIYGLLIGLAIGITLSLILSAIGFTTGFRDGYWLDFISFLLATSIYSALWTMGYAYLCWKKAGNNL